MKEILIKGAEELGIELSDESAEKLLKYAELLVKKNQVMNLTAITEEKDIAALHFLDSLAIMKYETMHGKKIIDIGSGAGFPGLPLKIADSSISLTLLDAQKKRVDFLTELCAELGTDGVSCIHGRAEETAMTLTMRDKFDFAVSRAVARLNVLCELCMPFVKKGGAFIAMKSVDSEEEINEAKAAVKKLGGKIEKVIDYPIPDTDVIHRLIIIRKETATPKGFPRRFSKIQKTPLM